MCLAIPGCILEIQEAEIKSLRIGRVNFGGIQKKINLSLVPEAKVNDYVLVHVGVAISLIDREEAKKTLRFLEGLGELDDLKIDSNL